MEIVDIMMMENISQDVLDKNGYSFVRRIGDDKFIVVDTLGKIKTLMNKSETIEFVKNLK